MILVPTMATRWPVTENCIKEAKFEQNEETKVQNTKYVLGLKFIWFLFFCLRLRFVFSISIRVPDFEILYPEKHHF